MLMPLKKPLTLNIFTRTLQQYQSTRGELFLILMRMLRVKILWLWKNIIKLWFRSNKWPKCRWNSILILVPLLIDCTLIVRGLFFLVVWGIFCILQNSCRGTLGSFHVLINIWKREIHHPSSLNEMQDCFLSVFSFPSHHF